MIGLNRGLIEGLRVEIDNLRRYPGHIRPLLVESDVRSRDTLMNGAVF